MKTSVFVMANTLAILAAVAMMQGIAKQEPREKFSAGDTRSAEAILREAASAARNGKRNLFVVVGTSWCHGCSELMKSLGSEPLKDVVGRNYVVVKLQGFEAPSNSRLENEGVREYVAKWAEGSETGFPYYVVLDSNLRFITDCLDRRRSRKVNMVGFLGAQGDHFVAVLKLSAKNLRPGDIERLERWIEDQ